MHLYRPCLLRGMVAALLLLGGCELFGPGTSGRPLPVVVAPADDRAVPDPVRERYREDAARLAARHLDASGEDGVALPAALVRSFYHALIRVYNAHGLAARDSVTALYPIHTFPDPPLHRLLVAVDTTAAWTAAWRRGQRLTGYGPVDRLMNAYSLRLDRLYRWQGSPPVAALYAAKPVHVPALARRFTPIDGVVYAEPDGVAGDGSDITADAGRGYWELTYRYGYGDCPAGCIYRHQWIFRVYADGRVVYVRSSGAPLPPR